MSLVAVWDYLATADHGTLMSMATVIGFVLWPMIEGTVEVLRWLVRRLA